MVCPLVDGADVEHPDVTQGDVEHADGLADRYHGGVVGPYPAVDKPLPVDAAAGKKRRRGGSRHGDVDHRDPPVAAQPLVVGRLEQVHFAPLDVPRRNDQPLAALPQTGRDPSTSPSAGAAPRRIGVGPRAQYVTPLGPPAMREDPRGQRRVVFDDLFGAQPRANPSAMTPPADVPAMRSNASAMQTPRSASSRASTCAVNRALAPPPSSAST